MLNQKWLTTEQTLSQLKPTAVIKDKLSQQLELNVALMSELNTELTAKDKALQENQVLLREKDIQIAEMAEQLGLMQSKVHSLA